MSTDVEERGRAEAWRGYLDATGAHVESREEALVSPRAITATARMTLHNGAAVTFELEVEYNPNSYPFVVTGGQITGTICGAPWTITGGHFGDDLRIDARRAGQGSCADTFTAVGEFQHPACYRGTYGFNGAATWFRHTTLYRG